MKYQEFTPSAPLSDYIQLIWIMESESPKEVYPKEKILPDGIVELVFHYKDPFINYFADGRKLKQPDGFAISQMSKFIEIESDGEIGFISVRFYPWGAHHFFKKPIKSFIDDLTDAGELWEGGYQKDLGVLTNLDDREKVNRVEEFLMGKLNGQKTKKNSDLITDTIKLIRDTRGSLPIDDICKQTGLSYKQLERYFVSSIGVSPKVFSRTTRFLHLCHHIGEYENKTMTQLAYDMGYYDQAHFNKEFKEFSGLTPKEYFRQKNISFADF
ncbi:helix-turn-helix domain-containing protein [Leptobacterium flavescens]|uniref:Helix-turn-helix domain-containing protein n=1 Tax=Leptobacterium flavescens TaxID=472055 RepID=A0A6P0ULY0_9FLAO|nr:helix-turn-helix domain-containing protein [Leptobacterium flavescens]NER12868.1 helix-turn-helix domain-containing protein [Leptobacterium flavescens]